MSRSFSCAPSSIFNARRARRIAGFLLAVGSLAAVTLAQAAPARPFRFAMEDYPPFEYEENGQPVGINVEVTTRIMQRLGIPFEIEFYPFTRSWMLLAKGKIDAAPSISYQPERETVLLYSDAQKAFQTTGNIPEDHLWLTEYVFFVNRRLKPSLRFESYAQLKRDGHRVGVNKAYTYHPPFWKESF
ncbi:MAG: transporter substrate-binding domain-containing protein, partial [Verrucomicrobia bacterium]|nr:transporter substrate-binding domain-containing protein [Verrucomicrobiota bacterium]